MPEQAWGRRPLSKPHCKQRAAIFLLPTFRRPLSAVHVPEELPAEALGTSLMLGWQLHVHRFRRVCLRVEVSTRYGYE